MRRGSLETLVLRTTRALTPLALLAIVWLGWSRYAALLAQASPWASAEPERSPALAQTCNPPGEDATDLLFARFASLSQALKDARAQQAASNRLARAVLERTESWRELSADRSPEASNPPPARPGATPPPGGLRARAVRSGDAVDVLLDWDIPPNAPEVRFEIWRWVSDQAPDHLASDLAAPSYRDRGLAEKIRLGYVIYAVTPGEAFSTSEGRAVLVDLPAVHTVDLVETPQADRSEPPPLELPTTPATPASERPERIRLRIRRLEDGRSEEVTVEVGNRIGEKLRTAFVLVETSWVECHRPIRYVEPVFQPDGKVVIERGEVRRRTSTLNLPVFLPGAVLRDGWGRLIRLRPPLIPPTFRAGTDRGDR